MMAPMDTRSSPLAGTSCAVITCFMANVYCVTVWDGSGRLRKAAGAAGADGFDFGGGDVKELEELLMFGGSGLLELHVPALHVLRGETGGGHDGRPFLFGNHTILSHL